MQQKIRFLHSGVISISICADAKIDDIGVFITMIWYNKYSYMQTVTRCVGQNSFENIWVIQSVVQA